MSNYRTTEVMLVDVPDEPQHHDVGVPLVIDDFALAMHLGVRCKTLWYCVNSKNRHYKIFSIPKAKGGRRILHAPSRVMKYVQRRISRVILGKMPLLPCVGAYVPGKSCKDVAAQHVNQGVLVKMDLKDFFPTHTRGRVRGFFHRHVGYSDYVSGLLADLCTAPFDGKHKVPQGSPASPTLCNLMAQHALDRYILARLEGTGWVYTRYSDDITLSHPDDVPSSKVNKLIDDVQDIIRKGGYKTNRRKTKVQRRWRQQRLLGLVVNERAGISRETYRRYRAILHNCRRDGWEPNAIRYGWDGDGSFKEHLQGKVSYFASVDPVRGKKLKDTFDNVVAELAARQAEGEAHRW